MPQMQKSKTTLNGKVLWCGSPNLQGTLWTGDKPLYAGLHSLGFEQVCNTNDLLELRSKRMRE